MLFFGVTPCVGVWIEIAFWRLGAAAPCRSLPAWECGLKLYYAIREGWKKKVTPCVGVWIEISIVFK